MCEQAPGSYAQPGSHRCTIQSATIPATRVHVTLRVIHATPSAAIAASRRGLSGAKSIASFRISTCGTTIAANTAGGTNRSASRKRGGRRQLRPRAGEKPLAGRVHLRFDSRGRSVSTTDLAQGILAGSFGAVRTLRARARSASQRPGGRTMGRNDIPPERVADRPRRIATSGRFARFRITDARRGGRRRSRRLRPFKGLHANEMPEAAVGFELLLGEKLIGCRFMRERRVRAVIVKQ